jgi:predicted amidophosphoribosyltransferase
VAGVVALTTWRDPVARAVLHAKLEGRAEVFAALGPRVAAMVGDPPDVVVAVPTDRRRVRERGADHTRVFASAVGAALRRPVVRALRVGTPIPDRGRAVAGERSPVPADAFVATRRAAGLAGAEVLLVDDVVTTGGTLVAAATSLLVEGIAEVSAAVVARAGGHVLDG